MRFFDYSGEVLAGQDLLCYRSDVHEQSFFVRVRVALLAEC